MPLRWKVTHALLQFQRKAHPSRYHYASLDTFCAFRSTPPPAYSTITSTSKPVVPTIVKDSPSTPSAVSSSARLPPVASAKSLLGPASPRPYSSPTTSSAPSGQSTPASMKPVDPKNPVFFSTSPSVVLASSGNRAYQRWRMENLRGSPSRSEDSSSSRLTSSTLPPSTPKQHQPRTRAPAASGHFRSNIEDEDDLEEETDRLLTLPEILQKPPPTQRKIQKSVSSTFLPWPTSSGPSKQRSQAKQTSPAPRKTSLTNVPGPDPARPKAKFTISVSDPDEKKVEDEKSGTPSPAAGKRYIIRQSPSPRLAASPRKSRVTVASPGTPARVTVVSEVAAAPSASPVARKSSHTQPIVSRATVSFAAQKVSDPVKRSPERGILGQAILNVAEAEAKSKRPSLEHPKLLQTSSDRRPSVERDPSIERHALSHTSSERRPSGDRGHVKSPRSSSDRRPSTDQGKTMRSTASASPSPVSTLSATSFPTIRPPPSVRPGSAVQPLRGSQTSLASVHSGKQSPCKDSLSQPKL